MDNRTEVREFLVSRRARLRPTAAGLPDPGGVRRVPGLRRGEVAELAGVSVEYYTRLERGDLQGVSPTVIAAVGRALQLDQAERVHLENLARTQGPGSRRRTRRPQRISPELQAAVDGFTGGAAFVRNGRMDVLATNLLARAVYADLFTDPLTPPNIARFAFLDERARDFYPDWERAADDIVAILRAEAGRDPDHPDLAALVGSLATRSPEFAVRWGAHDVKQHSTGHKHFRHPLVGDLHLGYQALEPALAPGLLLLLYTPRPDTGTAEALQLLASWATTTADRG